jgi:hypothetical protein
LGDLYSHAKWGPVSRVRHFWGQLGVLKTAGYLDLALAQALFAEDATYWWKHHFERLEAAAPPHSLTWRTTWTALAPWLSKPSA